MAQEQKASEDARDDIAHPNWRSFAEYLGLGSLIVAQPVLASFAGFPGAFVAARARTADMLVFLILVLFGLPAVVLALELVVGLAGTTARRRFHRVAIGALVLGVVLQLFPGPAGILLGMTVALGASYLFMRSETAEQFLRFLAMAPFVFLGTFLLSPANRLLFPSEPPVAQPLVEDESLPPVVMVLFDELPLSSLLDGEGTIDADAFPAFAELAQSATFARNHTSISAYTTAAVPAVLTSNLPEEQGALANFTDHPESLFTLLGAEYRIRAAEHVTEMCPPSLCEVPADDGETRQHPLRALLGAARHIPFATDTRFDIQLAGAGSLSTAERFEWLTDGFEGSGKEPTLHYIHSMLPHQAWVYLPDDGVRHGAPSPLEGTGKSEIPDNPALAEHTRQLHLMQLAYADQLLGDTIESLKEERLYDEALVVVTSDHGVSLEPGEPSRFLTERNYPDVLWTPLLVKAPNQTEPSVLDSPTSSLDVLPTIVDVLGLDTDWSFDGQSVFEESRPSDWQPRAFHWEYDEVEPDDDGYAYFDGPAGYEQVMDSAALDYGPDHDMRLFRWGDHGEIVGRRVDTLDVAPTSDATVHIESQQRFESVDLSAPVLPVYVAGEVTSDVADTAVVSVNGVIGGSYDTSGAPPGGEARRFEMVFPPSLLHEGTNEIEVYLLAAGSDEPVLIPADAES